MREQMRIMISDNEHVQDVKLALAKEHHDREGVFRNLQAQGHVRVLQDDNPALVRCQIEDEIFSEERERFPSTTLMARLQLAIASGQSCRNSPLPDREDLYADFAKHFSAHRMSLSKSTLWAAYGDFDTGCITKEKTTIAKVTAAVKKLKGLRP